MKLIANSINGTYLTELVQRSRLRGLTQIDLAVAYTSKMKDIFDLAKQTKVPLNLYTLADGHGFPNISVANKFVTGKQVAWRLFLTRDFYHPKLMWFRGCGVYIGSANLTDKAWHRNVEQGVWVSHDEIIENNWDNQLSIFFAEIRERCKEATVEDVQALESLQAKRAHLLTAEREFQAQCDELLKGIPGASSPIDSTVRRSEGGIAKRKFLDEWDRGLTILRKITKYFESRRDEWPRGVGSGTHPTIAQDMAMEWWWDTAFRRQRGETNRAMRDAHEKNGADPMAAVRQIFDDWRDVDWTEDEKGWLELINDYPIELRELVQLDALEDLDAQRLGRILFLCHSSREHGRQIPNPTLGIAENDTTQHETRIELYAQYLLRQRTESGHNIEELLRFVLWGDREGHVAERIWSGGNDDKWKLKHLGVHIFGELIGYARPEEYPPRNNRVSKILFALGFDGIDYH